MVSEQRHFLPTQRARLSRMRKLSSRPGAMLRTYRSEDARSVYCRERATRDASSVAASTASPAYRRCLRRAWWSVYSWCNPVPPGCTSAPHLHSTKIIMGCYSTPNNSVGYRFIRIPGCIHSFPRERKGVVPCLHVS